MKRQAEGNNLRLGTSDTTTPVSSSILVLVGEVGLGGLDQGSQSLVVLGSNVLQGDDSGSLLVNDCAQSSLVLDNDVGDTHLSAQSGQEDDELDGVDVVGDDDQGSLLGFDEGDTVVETVLGEQGLLAVLGGVSGLVGSLGLGFLQQSGLLLLLGFGLVLVEQLEQLGGGVLVQGVTELGDRGGDLQSLVEDDLLSLQSNVLGPLDESGQILLGSQVTTCNGRSVDVHEVKDYTYRYRRSWSSFRTRGSGEPSWPWSQSLRNKSATSDDVDERDVQGAEAGRDFPLTALGCRNIQPW